MHNNGSQHENPSTPSPPVVTTKNQIQNSMLLLVAIFAFVSNTLAIVILCRPRAKTRIGSSIRFNLSLLSSAEIGLSLFTIIRTATTLAEIDENRSVPALIYSSIGFWNINGLICSRNWFVALIAFSRCEAVFRPMESISGNHFNTKRLKCYAAALFLFSYIISLTRIFSKKAEICNENGHIDFQFLLYKYNEFRYFEAYGFFAFQSILPVLTVFISTLFLIYVLVNSRPTEGQVNSKNRQGTQRKATRTVLVLAVVFTVMETPVFIITVLKLVEVIVKNTLIHDLLLFGSRLFVILDSSCNVFIYVLTSDRFRIELVSFIKEIRHCGRRPSGYRYNTTAELVNSTAQPQMLPMLKRVGTCVEEETIAPHRFPSRK